MAEAAEKRLKESDGRGLKDPEGFKRKQLAQQKAAEQDMSQGGGEANLKVSYWFVLQFFRLLFIPLVLTCSLFLCSGTCPSLRMRKRYI